MEELMEFLIAAVYPIQVPSYYRQQQYEPDPHRTLDCDSA